MAGAPMPTGLRATPPAKGRAPPPANGGHVVHVASSRAPWHSEDAAPARRSAERDVQPRAFHGSTQLSAGPPLVGLNYASRALENVRAPRASEKVSTRAARCRTGLLGGTRRVASGSRLLPVSWASAGCPRAKRLGAFSTGLAAPCKANQATPERTETETGPSSPPSWAATATK